MKHFKRSQKLLVFYRCISRYDELCLRYDELCNSPDIDRFLILAIRLKVLNT